MGPASLFQRQFISIHWKISLIMRVIDSLKMTCDPDCLTPRWFGHDHDPRKSRQAPQWTVPSWCGRPFLILINHRYMINQIISSRSRFNISKHAIPILHWDIVWHVHSVIWNVVRHAITSVDILVLSCVHNDWNVSVEFMLTTGMSLMWHVVDCSRTLHENSHVTHSMSHWDLKGSHEI